MVSATNRVGKAEIQPQSLWQARCSAASARFIMRSGSEITINDIVPGLAVAEKQYSVPVGGTSGLLMVRLCGRGQQRESHLVTTLQRTLLILEAAAPAKPIPKAGVAWNKEFR